MKTSTTVFLLLVLLSAAPVHDQNRSDDAAPPRRTPFRHPGSKRHFDKAGMNFFAGASFQDRDYSRPWRSAMEPYHKRSERWMNSPGGLFEKSRHEQNTPLRANRAPGSNETQSLSDSVQAAWVKHYASQSLPGLDEATAIAVDGAGNVYVTGYSPKSPFGTDYLTAKYNATGAQLWATRYGGNKHVDNLANAITVDGAGNVYVTGSSFGSGTSYDYATIKYNAAGEQQWVARYNGPGNTDDEANALAVDGAGNVYVTGFSDGPGTSEDYATIKYNAAGAQQWAARYNGPGNDFDYANALAIDGAGNVYVTGYSSGSGTGYDYATIKYNVTGIQQWVVRYNGPRNANDFAYALAIDGAGNVYVTGRSAGSGTSDDYATIKYNVSGVQQWVARYDDPGNSNDGASALAVDGAGNVYVTGYSSGSGTSDDYATIKYNPAGAQQWVARYNGPGNGFDYATALAVDGAGNVYVTGSSSGSGISSDYATIKYNAAGVQQWAARYNGPGNFYDAATALAVDGAGNVYVTGESDGSGTSYDYATIKYNAAGVQQWVARYNGPENSDDEAIALAVDGAGNVYVTGESKGSGTFEDYATIKYNAAGEQQWIARYNGPGNSYDGATALAVDGAGNVYVTGESEGSGTSSDYATIKYNTAGVQQWFARYDDPGNSNDGASALAVDGIGNVYVTGSTAEIDSLIGTSNVDYATIKYNAAGEQQWVARYSSPGNSFDYATALMVDGAGNVYVTGESDGSGPLYGYVTIKYNAAGVQQWVAGYHGPGNSNDGAHALAIDGAGNVYVTGHSDGSGTSSDYATIKYNAAGVQQWVARYNGPGNSYDGATALAIDGAGNVYVTGASDGSGTSYDYATVKYNAAGIQQWVARYNGPGNDFDLARALVVDGAGNVYVTGDSYGSGNIPDYATIKYSATGNQQWIARYRGPGSAFGYANALAVDGAGNVYVTGESSGDTWDIYTTIKYVQTPVAVKEKELGQPNTYRLAQNYPNPFNPSTTIRYGLAKSGHVTLKVFNLYGQEIATLVNETKSAGEYKIQWNPNNVPCGVYMYRLRAGEFVQTRKLVLLQ